MAATPASSAIRYMPTKDAYDRWALVYDTDGNFLQAMDDIGMRSLLPNFEASIQDPKPWKLVDLGCGTGRNTALLLGIEDAEVIALDASPGMLQVAEKRLREFAPSRLGQGERLQLGVFDLIASEHPPENAAEVNGIISTLVLEHIPLEIFFRHVARMLKPGGALLLTNMHAEMGNISQAGFVDTETGEKIRPTSYAHRTEDIVKEAERWGLIPFSDGISGEDGGGLLEKAVTEGMVEDLGPRSRKWIGVTCWFGGLFRKTSN